MMHVVHFFDDAPDYGIRPLVEETVGLAIEEVRSYLPELPDKINIWLGNAGLIPDVGAGGYAYAPDIINIVFDPDFSDKELQAKALRGIVFHESYHLVQGHTDLGASAVRENMLDNAIYEGAATVFERQYAGIEPAWGDYSSHTEKQLRLWQDKMLTIRPDEYINNDSLWGKWAYYDPEDFTRWKLYKTGVWIVGLALQASGCDIVDLRRMSGKGIRKLLVGY